MRENLQPSAALRRAIISRIRRVEYRRARAFLITSGFAVSLSVVAIALSISHLAQAFRQSSFIAYLSLLISDTDVVVLYWREFALSVVESAPFLGLTLALSALLALLASVRVFAHNLRIGLIPARTIH